MGRVACATERGTRSFARSHGGRKPGDGEGVGGFLQLSLPLPPRHRGPAWAESTSRHAAMASPEWLGCIWVRRAAELSVPGPRVSVCQALGVGRGAGGLGALVCPLRGSDLACRVVLAALPRGPGTAEAETDRDTEST